MRRFAFVPAAVLGLASALAAGASAADRYGPSATLRTTPAEVSAPGAPAAPALRRLSWPGKTELRPALAPAAYTAPVALPTATGRFPGVAAYTPRSAAPAGASAPPTARTLPPPPAMAARAPAAIVVPTRSVVATPTLPPPPASAPSAAPLADPPPAIGRYGYVGPGRAPAPATPPSALGAPHPPAYARAYVSPSASQGATSAPPPVTPAEATPGQPGAPVVAAAPPSGGSRRYSLHRQYGLEPDPVPVPPQFFASAPDLSAPETEPAVARQGAATSKAAVNAARLKSDGG